jgi:hypothetical protein
MLDKKQNVSDKRGQTQSRSFIERWQSPDFRMELELGLKGAKVLVIFKNYTLNLQQCRGM